MVRQFLLGTSALAVAALACGAWPSSSALAQEGEGREVEVRPGGALNITISGFIRALAIGGDVDNARLDETFSTGLDFFNDTEVHVEIEGESEATGLTYGGTVEFEADTNRTDNTDESFVFLEGGFGEVRLGDEDGVADLDGMAVSAASIGAGTDGLDSDQFEVLFGEFKTFEAFGTSDASKIRYYTPSFGGLQLGVSYTPNLSGLNSGSDNGDNVASRDVEGGDVVEGGVKLEQEFGGIGLEAGLTGLYGDIEDEDAVGGDDYWAAQAGAVVELFGFKLAGSYLKEKVGAAEIDAVTAGVAVAFGPEIDDEGGQQVEVSLSYGQIIDSEDLTATTVSGDDLDGDVGYFDNDASGDVFSGGDDGYQAVGRLGLAF